MTKNTYYVVALVPFRNGMKVPVKGTAAMTLEECKSRARAAWIDRETHHTPLEMSYVSRRLPRTKVVEDGVVIRKS